jgi:hypothetical protein
VTDRLAYLNFVEGSLANTLAKKLDSARTPFKVLRDAENALTPRRNIRGGIALQISRIEHDQQKGTEKRLSELRELLRRHEAEDESKEKQVEILKRRAVKESEQEKWDAIREVCLTLVYTINTNLCIFNSMPRSLCSCHNLQRPLYQRCHFSLHRMLNRIEVPKPQQQLELRSNAHLTTTRQGASRSNPLVPS